MAADGDLEEVVVVVLGTQAVLTTKRMLIYDTGLNEIDFLLNFGFLFRRYVGGRVCYAIGLQYVVAQKSATTWSAADQLEINYNPTGGCTNNDKDFSCATGYASSVLAGAMRDEKFHHFAVLVTNATVTWSLFFFGSRLVVQIIIHDNIM